MYRRQLRYPHNSKQLHRDTTVHALTSQPVLAGGKVTWEDSPLVRAARHGRVLIVDEADKAPLQVVCILKGLVEDGQMVLGDGRMLASNASTVKSSNVVIPIHPNFRMIVSFSSPNAEAAVKSRS
jgi:MoxR-like ATPase